MRIVFTGGGTGGHIFPFIAVARQLKTMGERRHQIYFLGPRDDFSYDAFNNEHIRIRWIAAGSPSKGGASEKIKIMFGVVGALWHLFWIMPDVVFSKGGFGAAPVLAAAWIYNIPIVLHDSDSMPGRVTQLFAPKAASVFLSFPEAAQHIQASSVSVVGHPVRRELANGDVNRAMATWGVGDSRPVILLLGGSQGAQPMNDLIMEILPRLLERADVLHVTGKRNIKEVQEISKNIVGNNDRRYRIIDFLSETSFADAYALATLVISRGGAGSLFELAYLKKPSIIIPLPHAASGHQLLNARAYGDQGAAIVLEQENAQPNLLLDAIDRVLRDKQLQATMQKQAHAFSRIDADIRIANHLLTYE